MSLRMTRASVLAELRIAIAEEMIGIGRKLTEEDSQAFIAPTLVFARRKDGRNGQAVGKHD